MNDASTNPFIQLVTGIDNKTHDLVRWLGLISGLFLLIIQGISFYKTGTMDIETFGFGFSAILGSMGLALKLKAETEPPLAVDAIVKAGDISEKIISDINPLLTNTIHTAIVTALAAQKITDPNDYQPIINAAISEALRIKDLATQNQN